MQRLANCVESYFVIFAAVLPEEQIFVTQSQLLSQELDSLVLTDKDSKLKPP